MPETRRRERRTRERGRLGRAVILSAGPAGAGWRARVRVEPGPGDGAPFEAVVRFDAHAAPAAGPPVGAELDVLHHDGRAVAAGPMSARAPAPVPAPASAPAAAGGGAGDAPPAPEAVIAHVGRLLAQGALGGGPRIVVDDEVIPPPAGPGGGGAVPGAPVADLVARVREDPRAVAAEVRRRVAAGETTAARLWREAHALGPDGAAAARAVLAALAAPADRPSSGGG